MEMLQKTQEKGLLLGAWVLGYIVEGGFLEVSCCGWSLVKWRATIIWP